MSMGVVPVVVDYGGPGELVTPSTGMRVPLAPRQAIVRGIDAAILRFLDDPPKIEPIARAARQRVRQLFTWERKAEQVAQVYDWVTGARADKPFFPFLTDEAGQAPADAPARAT
jgi:glycosyltransferase involved in cell wall biosynthesis